MKTHTPTRGAPRGAEASRARRGRSAHLLVCATVLAASCLGSPAIAGDPSDDEALALAPTFDIDPPDEWLASFGDQRDADASRAVDSTLVVWHDQRTGGVSGGGRDIFAQVLRDDGSLEHAASLEVFRSFDRWSETPRAAWNGSHHLVVWLDRPAPGTGSGLSSIRGVRLTADGALADPESAPLIPFSSAVNPDVASDGDAYLILYARGTGGGQTAIEARRIRADGTPIDAQPIVVRPPTSSLVFQPRVAFGGGHYLAVWEEARTIRAARITPDGVVLDPSGVELSDGATIQQRPEVASDGDDFLVTWAEVPNSFTNFLEITKVSPQPFSFTTPAPVLDFAAVGNHSAGQMAFNGDRYLVLLRRPEPLFSSINDTYGVEVDSDGQALGSLFPIAVTEGDNENPQAVTSYPGGFVATWADDGEGGGFIGSGVHASRLSQGGFVHDPDGIIQSTSAPWQLMPALAHDGTGTLAAWEEWRQGTANDWQADIYAGRLTESGEPAAQPTVRLNDSDTPGANPHIAAGDGHALVVWEGDGGPRTIEAARVDATGAVLDPGGFTIAAALQNGTLRRPRAAFAGDRWLVVWHNDFGTGADTGVIGAVVGLDGQLIAGPFPVATQSFVSSTTFDVAAYEGGFAVLYEVVGDVRVQRIALDGTLEGVDLVASPQFIVTGARIVDDGSRWLVAWTSGFGPSAGVDIARVARDGTLTDGPTTVVSGIRGFYDLVMAYGRAQVITFVEGTVDGIRRVEVDPDGLVIGDDKLLVDVALDQTYANASAGLAPDEGLMVAYSGWTGETSNGTSANAPRIRGRALPGPGLSVVPGCTGNPAELVIVAGKFEVGKTFELELTAQGIVGGALEGGQAAIFVGNLAVDENGCGIPIAPGELLLSIGPGTPLQIGFFPLAAGKLQLSLQVPLDINLSGLPLAFQGLAIAPLAGKPSELSNALDGQLGAPYP